MARENSLHRIVEDLVDVLQFQAKELETLADQIQQVAGRLPESNKLSLVRSQLSELKSRISGLGESP